MLCLAVFNPCLSGLTFLNVPTTKGVSLAMTVGTEKFHVFETIVVVDAVFVLELKHDFLFVPLSLQPLLNVVFVYYESRKRDLKRRLINEGRSVEILKAKVEESTVSLIFFGESVIWW